MVTSAVALLVEGGVSCASTFRFWRENCHVAYYAVVYENTV